jgi:hypothetical protein
MRARCRCSGPSTGVFCYLKLRIRHWFRYVRFLVAAEYEGVMSTGLGGMVGIDRAPGSTLSPSYSSTHACLIKVNSFVNVASVTDSRTTAALCHASSCSVDWPDRASAGIPYAARTLGRGRSARWRSWLTT